MNAADTLASDLFNASLAAMLLTLVASLGMTYSVSQILAPTQAGPAVARGDPRQLGVGAPEGSDMSRTQRNDALHPW